MLLLVVTWWVRRRYGVLLGGGIVGDDVAASTGTLWVGPKAGSHRGARWRWLQLCMMVVVKGKDGWSQYVMLVMFQPRLLDLATRGHLLLINSDYY